MGSEIAVLRSIQNTMLPTVNARDTLSLTPAYMLEHYPKKVMLLYDDGTVVKTTTRKLVYSWYIWEFHRQYPKLELVYEHHVDSVLRGNMLSSNTHIELLGRISKYLILSQQLTKHHEKEKILSLIYYITNQLFNELPKLAGAYVQSIDILDILEISHDPEILDMKSKLEPNAGSILDFYAKAHRVIDSGKFKNNSLVQFIRMKILNMSQVNQCVLARGFPIEVTGTIMSTPIMSNYAAGMVKLYDYVADSRGAAKHLYSAEAPLQDTEFFARRLQLAGMVVEGVIDRDCGSTKYLEWIVAPPVITPSGRKTYKGDLEYLKGKLYLDETTGTLKEIMGNENKTLDGRLIKIRSALHCKERNQHMVCSHCFGMLWHNVSQFANLGHLCAATLTQQLTQIILSTKHVIASAIGAEFFLKADAQNFFTFNLQKMSFSLKPFNRGSKVQLVVNRTTAIGLTDIKLLSDISTINPDRISSLKSIEIRETLANGANVKIPVNVEQNGRSGHFSYEFLQFIREKGWTTNEYDHFVFDMTDWNPKNPIIYIPDVEYSYSDHADRIAKVIEATAKEIKKRTHPEAPAIVFRELFDLVNSKIEVNAALLEIMIYANMTPDVNDFGMARHADKPGLHVASSIIPNRSMGTAYAYSDQFSAITDPRSFFKQNRPDSPLDVYISPREVVAHKRALAFTQSIVSTV